MTDSKKDPPDSGLKAITVRLVRNDYNKLQEYAYARNTSLNTIVTEAIVEYGRKAERREALSRIEALRSRLDPAKVRPGTDAVSLVRQVREERIAHILGEDNPSPPGSPSSAPTKKGKGKS